MLTIDAVLFRLYGFVVCDSGDKLEVFYVIVGWFLKSAAICSARETDTIDSAR